MGYKKQAAPVIQPWGRFLWDSSVGECIEVRNDKTRLSSWLNMKHVSVAWPREGEESWFGGLWGLYFYL